MVLRGASHPRRRPARVCGVTAITRSLGKVLGRPRALTFGGLAHVLCRGARPREADVPDGDESYRSQRCENKKRQGNVRRP